MEMREIEEKIKFQGEILIHLAKAIHEIDGTKLSELSTILRHIEKNNFFTPHELAIKTYAVKFRHDAGLE